MSFLKIKDQNKRDETVKEFLELKNRIKDNFRKERIGEIETQSDLSKFFKPVTETQKATAKEITEQLKPIREGIEGIEGAPPQKAITFPTFPSVELSQKEILAFGEVATDALFSLATADEADRTFGIRAKNKKLHIGDKPIVIKGNNIIVGGEEYKGTRGFWNLVMLNKPTDYTDEDVDNYGRLMIKTNAIYRNYDPTNPNPRSSRSDKWKYALRDIWYNKEKYAGKGVTVVISEDPNALLERLDLLLSSQEAGHTGVGNKLVSICDELKRQGVINADTYKKLNSLY